MNILIIGEFPESTKARIRACFPDNWKLNIVPQKNAADYLAEAEVIIPEHARVDVSLLSNAPVLKFIQTGAGYDNVDLPACRERGITVCNASGVNANAVAEHVLALILAWYKNIPYLDSNMKNGCTPESIEYKGAELKGKIVGIIGLGNTGKRTAELCRAFGMSVLGYSHSPVDGINCVDFGELLCKSDIVSLHVPLTNETYHLIDCDTLRLMKNSAILINTSRGAVVNEDDLISALSEHRIDGACLDVFETEPLPERSRLRELPNVILTPHTAGLPDGVRFHQARYEFFAENIRRFFCGEEPLNRIK